VRRERRQIDVARRAVEDQLGHRLAGGGRVEHAPDVVAGRDVGAGDAGHRPQQRQAILCDRPEAGLPRADRCGGKRRRDRPAQRLEPRMRALVAATAAGSTGSGPLLEIAQAQTVPSARANTSGVSTSPLASWYSRNSASAGTESPVSKIRLWPL